VLVGSPTFLGVAHQYADDRESDIAITPSARSSQRSTPSVCVRETSYLRNDMEDGELYSKPQTVWFLLELGRRRIHSLWSPST